MRRCSEFDLPAAMELRPDGCGLFPGAHSDAAHPGRCGHCIVAFRLQTVRRLVCANRSYRSGCARIGFHDPEGGFLRASEGLLWIGHACASLFFRSDWLGDVDTWAPGIARHARRSSTDVGDEQLRVVLDCPFCPSAYLCRPEIGSGAKVRCRRGGSRSSS